LKSLDRLDPMANNITFTWKEMELHEYIERKIKIILLKHNNYDIIDASIRGEKKVPIVRHNINLSIHWLQNVN